MNLENNFWLLFSVYSLLPITGNRQGSKTRPGRKNLQPGNHLTAVTPSQHRRGCLDQNYFPRAICVIVLGSRYDHSASLDNDFNESVEYIATSRCHKLNYWLATSQKRVSSGLWRNNSQICNASSKGNGTWEIYCLIESKKPGKGSLGCQNWKKKSSAETYPRTRIGACAFGARFAVNRSTFFLHPCLMVPWGIQIPD